MIVSFFILQVVRAESRQKTKGLNQKEQNQQVEQVANDKYQAIFLKDYTPSSFLIESADLLFALDPKETTVNAKLSIKRNPAAKVHNTSITLDGIELDLQSIKLNGQLLSSDRYKLTSENLTILQVPDEDEFVLETAVKIHPDKNLTLTGLYLTNDSFCTKNETYGFRRITYFIDRPDILTKFTVTIIADKTNYPVMLSNGNLLAKSNLENNKHSVTWQDPFPKSPYLFALVAGNYGWIEDYHTTTSGRKVTLRIFVNHKQLNQCYHAMSALKQAMAWDERVFDLEYDLDLYQIVAVDDYNSGATENKGLNIFNSKLLLASPDTTTDDGFNRITSVVAHEYFHNWTGNRVACRDWFQIALKEGLTTFREQMFMEDTQGQVTNRIGSINFIRTKQFAEDSGPLSHPIYLQSYINVRNFYTSTVYEKTAEVARMLCTIFGRTVFQQIMKDFIKQFDGKTATIEDFLKIAEIVTKTDLKQFKLWFDQSGTPTLSISDNYTTEMVTTNDLNQSKSWFAQLLKSITSSIMADNDCSNGGSYSLRVEQKHPESQQDFFLPLVVGLVSPDGKNTQTQTLLVDKKEQVFSFYDFAAKPIPSLLRGFSAPVKIEYPYSDDDLLLLMRYDQDPIGRWDASQKLMTNVFLHLYEDVSVQKSLVLPQTLVGSFKTILSDKKIEPALAALMLQIPTENCLLETLSQVDIESMHNVREFIQLELAKTLKAELLECYNNNVETKYSNDALSVGKRKLKNLCLYYLMLLNTDEIFDLCLRQLERADNFTDRLAYLTALANSEYSNKDQILEDYYQKWQDQPNLVNNWLALNATIKLPGTLERIEKLMLHPAFNIKNPNKVKALIHAFCENNLINFHTASGAGYKFLADQVLAIDKFNPDIALIIVLPLTSGHKLDKERQQLMQQQLVRIGKEPGLSKGVYEIIGKAIDQ